MTTYRYYVIRNIGDKKEIYGVYKETKKLLHTIVIRSSLNPKLKGKKITLSKSNLANNTPQFDFTLNLE